MFNFGRIIQFCFFFYLFICFRIICRLESDSNIARCMTIRVAGKDEWHERRAVIKQCDIQLNDDDMNSKKIKKNFTNTRKASK
jgi:hypothetical protein